MIISIILSPAVTFAAMVIRVLKAGPDGASSICRLVSSFQRVPRGFPA